MNNKYLSTALIGCAIALSAVSVNAEENDNATSKPTADSAFVCAVEGQTPTMFAYMPGETNLTPVMKWYSEYLLPKQSGTEVCQQTAARLQDSYQQEQAKYLKAETTEDENSVCLVNAEDKSCTSEDSQKLFSVNPNYDATCVLENKKPIECKALQVRGIYSFDDEPYQPLWWFW